MQLMGDQSYANALQPIETPLSMESLDESALALTEIPVEPSPQLSIERRWGYNDIAPLEKVLARPYD
jgi:hypothetical protein